MLPTLLETIRLRNGLAPLWYLHLRRLVESCRALGVPFPGELLVPEQGSDRVHRLEVGMRGVQATERPVGLSDPVWLATSRVVHSPYPHKTTDRQQFDRVLEESRAAGVQDGVMLTDSGHLAECAIWSLFWWDGEVLCAPAGSLGVLPGVARRRIAELHSIEERRSHRRELDRVSLFVANAVRGVVPVAMLDGRAVAPHAGTARLMERFWP